MQRMIRQFAAEYTSKTTQDDPPLPNGTIKDQSLPRAASGPPGTPGDGPSPGPLAPLTPLALPAPGSPTSSSSTSPAPGRDLSPSTTAAAATSVPASALSGTAMGNGTGGGGSPSGAGGGGGSPSGAGGGGGSPSGAGGGGSAAASAQNPVLSKLLMADQDCPLDLTVKKSHTELEPSQQDGVLDLSTKKNSCLGGGLLKASLSFCPAPIVKGPSQRVDRAVREDEEDGLLPRTLQDGLRDFCSTSLKPPLARSLLIKEELLSHRHHLLNQPAALSLANLESAGLLNHGPSHPLLGREGSSSPWGGKAHLDSLLKLKQTGGSLSDLKELPLFLDNHHHHAAFSSKSSLHHHHHHNQVSKGHHHHHHHHHEAKREQGHSPPVDLKIPQVRGMDLSWDSHATDLYGYGAVGAAHGENALSRKLRAILPKQSRRGAAGGSLGGLLDGAADYWGSDVDHPTSGGPAYSTSDAEGDPGSKQPRKKRGRYRQYNSEILEEAIAVVMNGKMSVSKAQNIYGIPHSTLEYKVKERMGTLKNPPKKKLKLMMRMEGGGQDSAAESENTPTATPRDDGLPLAAAELKDD